MNRSRTLVVAAVILLGAGQVALAQVDWTLHEKVISPGLPGERDDGGHMLGDIVLVNRTYHLYLVGGHGTDPLDYGWSVGHWSSTNVTGPWAEDPANPVLEPTPGSWDGFSILRPTVWHDGATFHMWYGAVDVYHGVVNAGFATDADGFGDWTKVAGPLGGLGPGIPGQWNDTGPAPGTVLSDGAAHGMWFTTFAGGS